MKVPKTLSPYNLCLVSVPCNDVQGGILRYIGQVISKPIADERGIPNQKIMIRRVPGHPGTLIELPLSSIQPAPTKYKWVHYAKVTGRFSFPTDMFRYDSCVPVNFKLERSEFGTEKIVRDESFGMEGLVVVGVGLRKNPGWTSARWASFSWNITPLQTLAITDDPTRGSTP